MIAIIISCIGLIIGLIIEKVLTNKQIKEKKNLYNDVLTSHQVLMNKLETLKQEKYKDEQAYIQHLKSLNQEKAKINNKNLDLIEYIFDNKHNLYTVPDTGLFLKKTKEGTVIFANKTAKEALNYIPAVVFDNQNFQTKEEFLEYYDL
jgi:hypothetical protein